MRRTWLLRMSEDTNCLWLFDAIFGHAKVARYLVLIKELVLVIVVARRLQVPLQHL